MVSRTIEKMILIAVGLTTVVIIGVPVLMYTMDTLANVSQLEAAQTFADRMHNYTSRVDTGQQEEVIVEITVPSYIEMSASGQSLTIAYMKDGNQEAAWSETYVHAIVLTPPDTAGIHTLTISLVSDEIHISFS